MSTAAINIGEFRRRRARLHGLGNNAGEFGGGDGLDTGAAGGPVPTIDVPLPDQIPEISLPPQSGTVSVPQLQSENSAGLFNNLQTPQPFYGDVAESGTNPYGQNQSSIPGVDGDQPFTIYTPQGAVNAPVGGGGAGTRSVSSTAGGQAYPVASVGSTLALPVSSTTGVLSSVESFFGTPLYTGSSITWGWALLIGAVAWLLLRKE